MSGSGVENESKRYKKLEIVRKKKRKKKKTEIVEENQCQPHRDVRESGHLQ